MSNATSPLERVFGELEREKLPFDEALAAGRMFLEKLAKLPPESAKRVQDALKGEVADGKEAPARISPLAGKTAEKCAKQVLADHGNIPMHFGAIAREALARGYIGKPSDRGMDQEALQHRTSQSFWATMHRAHEVFAKLGKGMFQLRTNNETGIAPRARGGRKKAKRRRGPERSDSIRAQVIEVLKKNVRPMRGTDIAHELEEQGVTTPAKGGLLAMVLSALRKRPDLFHKVARGVYTLKNQG